MSRPLLIGTIMRKHGFLGVNNGAVFYPFGGNSGVAEDFRMHFGECLETDIGRRLYYSAGHIIQMESIDQMREREGR